MCPKVEQKEFVTNQRKLADAVQVTTVHLSNFKNRKSNSSEELIERLYHATGITPYFLMTASAKKLDKKLLEFYETEKARKILWMSRDRKAA